MAVEKIGKLLKLADEKKTAIIAFECTDYNMVYAAVAAADAMSKPIIIMVDPFTCFNKNDACAASFAGIFYGVAEQFKVPVALHLDHSSDYRYILGAIKGGFHSVMYDGSTLTLEENIENSRKVVEAAEAFGVEVEGELGRVGFARDDDEGRLDMYTKPEVAAYFCEQTGVGSLAIAIGSAHGMYKSTPKLDIDRLEKIDAATAVPLVLHGGSGIPEDQLRLAFQRGINKFNVGTEYFQTYYAAVSEFCGLYKMDKALTQMPVHILDMPKFVQKRMYDYMCKKLTLCTL
ncbi:MAG: class II fructose-bisphosphate aldolase [Clostridia bacterium]